MVLRSKAAEQVKTCGHDAGWRMLLSHHAPCDYDRTWAIGGFRVCVRCLAVFACAVLAFAGQVFFCWDVTPFRQWLCVLMIIPAWVDFSAGELLPFYPKTNSFRFLTGAVFGTGLGICLGWGCLLGAWRPLFFFCMGTVLLELAVAFLFYCCGHLEDYLAKYEEAVGVHVHHHHVGPDHFGSDDL